MQQRVVAGPEARVQTNVGCVPRVLLVMLSQQDFDFEISMS